MRSKIVGTISTGVFLGLLTLVVWFTSFRMLPSSSTANQNDVQKKTVLKPSKTIAISQTNFGQQIQAYILPISQANYLPIRNFDVTDPEIAAKSAALFDVKSEKILFAKNIHDKLPIASVTKLMTAIVVMENLSLNDIYTVTAEDLNADGNGADLTKGEQIKGGDLLKIMLIKSSNDAALVFSSNAAKKNINLVTKMNEKAASLGMLETKYSDPAGLDDGDSYSTIADLIKLVEYVNKYPVIWEISSIKTTDVSSIDGRFNHHLTSTDQLLDEIPGIVGGKTGFTNGALQTMVLEVRLDKEDNKVVAIVLGSNDRFGEIKKLIEWGKSAYFWE
jgi:serine-type D-Ala-D-Ala carboxypeptidase (penicillin-binding protein 5/6)